MADIRMIALDLDGTLLGADGKVSERNLAALLAAEGAGITVALATGRRHSYALKVLDVDSASILRLSWSAPMERSCGISAHALSSAR